MHLWISLSPVNVSIILVTLGKFKLLNLFLKSFDILKIIIFKKFSEMVASDFEWDWCSRLVDNLQVDLVYS